MRVEVKNVKKYDASLIKEALIASMESLGGMSKYVKPGETVLLKVNLLMNNIWRLTWLTLIIIMPITYCDLIIKYLNINM